LELVRDALHSAGRKLRFKPSVVGLGPRDVARLARERDPWWAELMRDAVVLLGPRPDALARPPRPGGREGGRRHDQEGRTKSSSFRIAHRRRRSARQVAMRPYSGELNLSRLRLPLVHEAHRARAAHVPCR
jgi:hypothetical protein